jgi:hypothetical protein
LLGGVLKGDGDLAVADLTGDADRVRPLLGEAGVIDDHGPADADGGQHLARQSVAGGAVLPGALVDELLQRLLVVGAAPVDGPKPVGHWLDTFAVAVQQQAAQVHLGPAPSGDVAKAVGQQAIQESRQVSPKSVQAVGVHKDASVTGRQLQARENLTE